jgi:hypothetical protein
MSDDIEELKKRPPLAGTLLPLRHWLGLDCLNGAPVFARLERLLTELKKTALKHQGPDAVETAQMLTLALDLLRTSQATLSQRIAILAEIRARVREEVPPQAKFGPQYAPYSDIDYGDLVRDQWQGQPVMQMLLQIGLLGAVYDRLPEAEKLLRWVARHSTPAWRVDLQLMLLTAYEGDLGYARMIFDKRMTSHLDAKQHEKIRREVLPALEEIHQLRLRFERVLSSGS